MAQTVTIHTPQTERSAECTRVTFPLDTPDGPFRLYYQVRGATPTPNATAAVAAVLLPAMRRGWEIQTDQAVSGRVLAAMPTIQDILTTWDGSYQRTSVRAPTAAAIPTAAEVGIFFSGGLDSFYSLLKHNATIDTAIFVSGFDIALDNHALLAKVSRALRHAAEQLGKPLIEVETNLRQFVDRYARWDMYHGAALASVGLLLSASLKTLFIPASDTYATLLPLGSHPLLDPLWSSEHMQILHDGCEANRLQKAALVAQNDVALQTIRVCWKNPDSAYNCGRCEKCLRTMVNLYAAGALDRCTTFAAPLDPGLIARMRMGGDPAAAYWQENLAAVQRRGTYPALERAVRAAVRSPSPLRRLFRYTRHKYFPTSGAL